ncbi:hypothetical protein SAMN05428988_0525 [Chitinophaga sp. YR573]|uniref:hypothetical protein n=1 Tax=Chitinophaga sp. YR573 TaxID=1881040 RepID=UPI0008B5F0DB|nr:hypothetical protein [Chitinophaga sp. YR573]SEV92805.1 hypothetical protein SAMN05428988_0525 [Chitinophaga sp. YR573]
MNSLPDNMDSSYSILFSSSPYVEFFRETMPLFFAAVLLYLHYKNKITALETIMYAFATEAYTMLMVGPTFTATFFVGVFFMVDQAHQLVTGRLQIRRKYLLLLALPLISNVVVFMIVQFYKDPFYYPLGKQAAFYFRPVYFYIKTYLPLFALASKIVQEREQLSFTLFSDTMKKIAGISFVIASIQIVCQYIFRSVTLGEMLGLQSRYMLEQESSFVTLRVQALFAEPKVFSAFLSLCIPLFVKDRQYRMTIITIIFGLLTASQTFWINMLAALLTFWAVGGFPSVRVKIFGTLGIIVCLFMVVNTSKNYFIKLYAQNQHNAIYQLVFKRSVYRYDNEIWQKDNVIMGMPLQRDMELPVVDFLRDQPYLLVSGYGAGNSTFIPSQYFFGQMNYENRVNGIGGHNLNMRWFYILVEFGMFSLFCFFFILTQTKPDITRFQSSYLAFIWVCFFFSQIDLFLIITALLSVYETKEDSYANIPG